MKKTLYILVLVVLCTRISAQTDTLKVSIKEAMQLGINNRFDAKESSLNIDLAHNQLVKSKKELLPDLSANGKLTYYGQLQPSIIPAGYLGFTEPMKIAIGEQNNTAFALDLNYPIYKPGLYTDIKIASNNLELEKEKDNKSDINIKIEIAESYDNVLLKTLQYEIAQKNEGRYYEYYELAKGKFDNGALVESDMLLAELDYKNAVANTSQQKQNYLLSIQNLKYKMNEPEHSVLVLTDSLQSSTDSDVKTEQLSNITANRSEIKQLTIEQAGYELQIKKARQNYLPSLSLFANYTEFFQGSDFNYSTNFYWSPVNYIGVKLSVPLTGSIKNINSVKESQIKLVQNGFMLKQKNADVYYEVQEALTKLDNAKKNLAVAKDNYRLSQKVYELKKQQYGLGSFSYDALLDTEKSLATAEQSYITSVYDFLIAKINFQKAIGGF
jgi:outer membrane protein TolC